MRKIKYRAKSLDTGEWVYGYYYNQPDGLKDEIRHIIVYQNKGAGLQTIHEPIDINTLGQCIGLRDENDKYLYEGDIVVQETCDDLYYLVEFKKDCAKYSMKNLRKTPMLWESRYREMFDRCCEIVGNIYDNYELLEEM
jgi:uncharacterized phage protein (TIGR01671 family)